ncbi:MAG: hypothetical protein JWO67_4552 [Streptosporangiaceae bacterium]|nr:hypothetical protein [Streptosporangiaceae bacterium]
MTDPTYAQVAEWLPTDVREHIEATMPCRVYGEHYWQHTVAEVRQFGIPEPIRIIEHWECPCGLVHTTDPEKRQ